MKNLGFAWLNNSEFKYIQDIHNLQTYKENVYMIKELCKEYY